MLNWRICFPRRPSVECFQIGMVANGAGAGQLTEMNPLKVKALPITVVRWSTALVFGCVAVLPFLFTAIPPLTDVPGHLGRFAVQTAPTGDPLLRYYGFHWLLVLNLASDLIVQLLYPSIDLLPLSWMICASTAFLTAFGITAIARLTNQQGATAIPWALLFVFNYPFLWGFLNFTLTFALSMLAFAAWMALDRWPLPRALLFVAVPPMLLIGHGVAGIVGIGLIVSYTLGESAFVFSDRPIRTLVQSSLPVLPSVGATLATLLLWKLFAAPDKGQTLWLFKRKTEALLMMLRDQNRFLDVGTVAACLVVGFAGWRWGARFRRGAAASLLFVTTVFIATPSLISGSDRIDTRLAPLIPMLFFAMQDWSEVRPRHRRLVMSAGFLLLVLRLAVTTASFAEYDRDYHLELTALQHVPRGARILNLAEVDCVEASWRSHRLEHLSNLATLVRGAWVNSQWSIDGLQLLKVRYQPSPDYFRDPSQLIWPARCVDFHDPLPHRVRHTLDEAVATLPLDRADFLWLVRARLPLNERDPRLRLIWADDISELYAIGTRH